MSSPSEPRCSDFTDEPLGSTAALARRWVCVEFTGGWGRDALDGYALGTELSQRIAAHMHTHDARFQFIRQPGRTVTKPGHRVFVADSEYGREALYTFVIDRVADLLDLDLSNPATLAGATRVDGPVALVCTHGKRDVCCALKGRPTAALLAAHAANATATSARVFETSHTGGHRFAPAVIMLPWGLTYGRLGPRQAVDVWQATLAGHVDLTRLRGRSAAVDKEAQAAEVAARSHLHLTGIAQVVQVRPGIAEDGDTAHGAVFRVVELADGRHVTVRVERRIADLEPRPVSCGDDAQAVTTYDCTVVDRT